MELHEIEKKAQGKSDEEKAVATDTLLKNANMVTVAGVLLGFYLYDSIYSFDYKSLVATEAYKYLPAPLDYVSAVFQNTVAAVGTAIAIEQYPPHLLVRGFRATIRRLLTLLLFMGLSFVIGFQVGGEKSVLLLFLSYSLFFAGAMEGYHRARLLRPKKKLPQPRKI